MNYLDNDLIQFSRLIAELEATGAFTQKVLEGLSNSMNLEQDYIFGLIERENIKNLVKILVNYSCGFCCVFS